MNLIKRLSALIACLFIVLIAHAQPHPEIRPMSFHVSEDLFISPEAHHYSFDQVAASEIDHREDKLGHMPRFASSIPTDISLTTSGTWTKLPGGDRVWRVQLHSPGALALIPCFDQFYIPAGASLHVYTLDHAEVLGAFTSANNPTDGKYNSGLIHGDACIIEYYEPASVVGQGQIHINELGHAYRMVPGRKLSRQTTDFGSSGSCEVNVRCAEGANWQDQKNAIVRILVKTGSNYGWCSGALVNNTNLDCTPYILSADHCYQDDITGALPSGSDLSQWVFYFQFESPTCANPDSVGTLANNFLIGCTFVAASLDTGGNRGSDFALIKMNADPPAIYTPYFAGWSNINITSSSGVGIHHPSADIKKISTYATPLQSVSWGGSVANTHWQILWSQTLNGYGVTEGGSSGSPIFDIDHHIVGTLTGGGSDCTTPTNVDEYGKFSFHWASNGTTTNKQLKPWLDPPNTGAQTLGGTYNPCTDGIKNLNPALTAISIYPNPSTGQYTITNAQNASSITVSDALGRLVQSLTPNGQAELKVDISKEVSGVYFLKFTSVEGSAVKKVVLVSGK